MQGRYGSGGKSCHLAVGGLPVRSHPGLVEVSLSKTPNPQLLLMSWLVPCMAANRRWCVNGWMRGINCTALWIKALYKCSPFTIMGNKVAPPSGERRPRPQNDPFFVEVWRNPEQKCCLCIDFQIKQWMGFSHNRLCHSLGFKMGFNIWTFLSRLNSLLCGAGSTEIHDFTSRKANVQSRPKVLSHEWTKVTIVNYPTLN